MTGGIPDERAAVTADGRAGEPPEPRTRDTATIRTGGRRLGLAELVSRTLDRGVVVSGDVVLGVAGVDLVYLGLDLTLCSVESLRARAAAGERG